MYFTRFGYLVIFSIIAVAAAAVLFVVWPFSDDENGSNANAGETPVVAATVTSEPPAASPTPLPSLSFEQVVNFAYAGAVVDITVTGGEILVNLRPDFDVSGLGTTSHTFTTTLPPGANSVEEALAAAGLEANTPAGVPVIRL